MRFKIGDQVVRPIIGSGLEVYQVVAIGGSWFNRRYIIGKKDTNYYISCSASELFACPETMLLPPDKLKISTKFGKARL